MRRRGLDRVLAEFGLGKPDPKRHPKQTYHQPAQFICESYYAKGCRKLMLSRYEEGNVSMFSLTVWTRSGEALKPWKIIRYITFTRESAPSFIACMRNLERLLVSGA